MKRSLWVLIAALSLLCVLWVPGAVGQAVYGSILGTVTDPSGAAVNGAKVSVTSQTKNVTTQETTNESGNYSVTHLIPDVYTVRIEGTGFKVLEFKDVQVSADTGVHLDGQFQVGSASEQVEVTAEAPQLKTDRADVSIEFSAQAVENAPILNRNFTSFELLSPGTQKLVGWSHAATENPQGGQQIFVNGQHFSGTAFELDGTDNQDPILGIIVVNPNLDAIQEAKVTLGNYDAEFGRQSLALLPCRQNLGAMISTAADFGSAEQMPLPPEILSRNMLQIQSPDVSFRLLAGSSSAELLVGRSSRTNSSFSVTTKPPDRRTELAIRKQFRLRC